MERYVDLHTHSSASDGTDSPENLIVKAKEAGLSAIALTDHCTLKGITRAQKKAQEVNIELVTGIELCTDHTVGEIHILGYWFNENPLENIAFQKVLAELKAFRDARNEQLFKNLEKVGIHLTQDDVWQEMLGDTECAGEESALLESQRKIDEELMCRPHIARAMMTKGYVPDLRTAFKKYLGLGGLAYTHKEKLGQKRVIEVLREAKAVVSFAHPYLTLCKDEQERKALIKKLKDYGLQGLECLYSVNTTEETEQSLVYAQEFGLAFTGGSDYHGKVKPDISLGKGKGNLEIPYLVLKYLKEES